MDKYTYLNRLSVISDTKKFVLMMLGASLGLNILLAIAVIVLPKGVRHELVPPTINKSFFVSPIEFDRSHIEQMGLYVAQLMLNATPKSVRFQAEQLLKMVNPDHYAEINNDVLVNAAMIEKMNVATTFTPVSYLYDPKFPNRIGVAGNHYTHFSDKTVQMRTKEYVIEFTRSELGSMELLQFKEAPARDPLGVVEEAKDAASAAKSGATQ